MRPELDRRSTIQRSLQEATEDIKAKLRSKDDQVTASVRDPPDLMRQHEVETTTLTRPRIVDYFNEDWRSWN